ncbi:hypothetical protein MMC28_003757 [Mycoblastus sanguinarius]|nr:hypothetical protein [Mycoblastus sanguinarius]
MNIFQCHEVNSWQCEWGNCSRNFSITDNDWHVYLRDDQKASIEIANSTFASLTTVTSSTTATLPAVQPAAVSSSGKTQQSGKSTDRLVIGLTIGLPVGTLLVACLGLRYWQRRQLSKAEAIQKSCEELKEAERQARGWALKLATLPPQEMPHHQVIRELGNAGADSHELAGDDGQST